MPFECFLHRLLGHYPGGLIVHVPKLKASSLNIVALELGTILSELLDKMIKLYVSSFPGRMS